MISPAAVLIGGGAPIIVHLQSNIHHCLSCADEEGEEEGAAAAAVQLNEQISLRRRQYFRRSLSECRLKCFLSSSSTHPDDPGDARKGEKMLLK